MAFILDHLVAVIVGGVVILGLIALQLDTQSSNTQAIGAEVTRAAAIDFVEVIEFDLRNILSPDTSAALVAWSSATPTAATPVTAFDFWTLVDTTLGVPQHIQYELSLADSVEVISGSATTTIPVYTLRRLIESAGVFAEDGQSPYGLTEFAITPLDNAGVAAATSDAARSLAVRMAFVPRWGGEGIVSDTRFETVFRPPGLSF